MYAFLLILVIYCRPGTKKDECKSRLKDKEGISFCSGGGWAPALITRNRQLTDDQKKIWENIFLLDCLLLEEARQKCRDASSYQPTIY